MLQNAKERKADMKTSGALGTVLFFPVATLLVYTLFRNGAHFIAVEEPGYIWAWAAVTGLSCAAFSWARYPEAPRFSQTMGRASAVFLAVYFVSEPFDIPYAALSADHPAAVFHHAGRWIGLALAGAAWFRPAALVAAAMLLWMMRDLHEALTGFYFSNLDIRNVVEVLAFAGIGFALIGAAGQRDSLRRGFRLDDETATRAGLFILAIGVGGHFGNYFYSALAKLMLDGGPLSWIFGNRLYDGVPGAVERGTLPFALSPALTQFTYDAMKAVNLPLHLASFAAQFAAVIAIFRRRWVMMLTAVYDLFHIIVYLSFGLLFWKWIALNTIFLITLSRVSDRDWTRDAAIAAVATVLFGAIFFKTATLAWYDAPGFMSVYFEAETQDGERYRVPSSYFGTSSYQVSQGRLYAPSDDGHFDFSIWGSVLTAAQRDAGRACKVPTRDAPPPERYGPVDALARFVWAWHARALERAGDDGRFNDRLYLHHHMPSPFVVRPFDLIDKREITGYYYVAESVCLSLEKGALKRDVLKRTEIPLPRPE
ncbi:hypothetical protein [Hyphococcus sp.]|uniref:hypothetical protein n=1 Tax=Hyphococcus sp. TaxID=2038636 RepID=UPI003D09B79B